MPSNIYLKAKKAGGMKITFQNPAKNLDEKMLYNILRDYKMLNCEVLVRDENGQRSVIVLNSSTNGDRSYGRRLHRCDYEGSPKVYQMVRLGSRLPDHIRVNTDTLSQSICV